MAHSPSGPRLSLTSYSALSLHSRNGLRRELLALMIGGLILLQPMMLMAQRAKITETGKPISQGAVQPVNPDTGSGAVVLNTLGSAATENFSMPELELEPRLVKSRTRFGNAEDDTSGSISEVPMSIRRRFTNNTGANITRLRFRIVEVTTFPAPPGTAELRALTSGDVSVTTSLGMLTVRGTTLEEPPTQMNGGGFNSTMSVGVITWELRSGTVNRSTYSSCSALCKPAASNSCKYGSLAVVVSYF